MSLANVASEVPVYPVNNSLRLLIFVCKVEPVFAMFVANVLPVKPTFVVNVLIFVCKVEPVVARLLIVA